MLLPGFFLAADHGQLGTAGAAARGDGGDGGGGGGGGENGGGGGGGTAALVLSSFSQPYKVAPETLQAWLAAMRRLPPSTSLALLDFQPGSMPLLRAELSARGVRAARLLAWTVRVRREHLARAASAALSLDTPGYNQG